MFMYIFNYSQKALIINFELLSVNIHFPMFTKQNLFVSMFLHVNFKFNIWVTCVITIVTFLCVSSHHSCASVQLECRTVIQHQHSSRTRKTTLSHLHSNVSHVYIALMGYISLYGIYSNNATKLLNLMHTFMYMYV